MKEHPEQGHLIIGQTLESEFEETKPEFRDYLENDQRTVGSRFKGEEFGNFLLKELTASGNIDLFFEEFVNILLETRSKWGKFEGKAISEARASSTECELCCNRSGARGYSWSGGATRGGDDETGPTCTCTPPGPLSPGPWTLSSPASATAALFTYSATCSRPGRAMTTIQAWRSRCAAACKASVRRARPCLSW